MQITRVARYDMGSLPKFPFCVIFMKDNEVYSKKVVRCTNARYNANGSGVELFISELNTWVEFNPDVTHIPAQMHLN